MDKFLPLDAVGVLQQNSMKEQKRRLPFADICISSRAGAIIGDGDHKPWNPRAPMIWDNVPCIRRLSPQYKRQSKINCPTETTQ